MNTFVMADIHGAYQALRQCLDRAGFDCTHDRLIQLRDVADGFNEVYGCVEELLAVDHLVAIRGNHDSWPLEFIDTGYHSDKWSKGGKGTLQSYLKQAGREKLILRVGSGCKTGLEPGDLPAAHRDFFRQQVLYHLDGGSAALFMPALTGIYLFEDSGLPPIFWIGICGRWH